MNPGPEGFEGMDQHQAMPEAPADLDPKAAATTEADIKKLMDEIEGAM